MTLPSVGIIGRRRVGKDTAADYLVREHGYARVGFADSVKEAALAIDPIVYNVDPDSWEAYNLELDKELVCADLWGDIRLLDLVNHWGWEKAKDLIPEVRRLLQRIGDEAGRQIHGENTWIDPAMKKITAHRLVGRPVVVSDVRYANEAIALRESGFTLVKIVRPSVERESLTDSHASEVETDTLSPDVTLENSGTVEDLLRLLHTAVFQ